MTNRAVFLDRDNTLIEDPGYLSDPAGVKLLPGVGPALLSLSAAPFKIVVVTNQSGIARGMFTEKTLAAIHDELRRQLAQHGAALDAIYYCPFLKNHPEGVIEKYAQESDMRKPRPGMLLAAARDLDIDLAKSWMVGDSARDIEAGQRAGCRTILIKGTGTWDQAPGNRSQVPGPRSLDVQADFIVHNMVEAAMIILRERSCHIQLTAKPA